MPMKFKTDFWFYFKFAFVKFTTVYDLEFDMTEIDTSVCLMFSLIVNFNIMVSVILKSCLTAKINKFYFDNKRYTSMQLCTNTACKFDFNSIIA